MKVVLIFSEKNLHVLKKTLFSLCAVKVLLFMPSSVLLLSNSCIYFLTHSLTFSVYLQVYFCFPLRIFIAIDYEFEPNYLPFKGVLCTEFK